MLMFLKKIKERVKLRKLPKAAEKVLLIVPSLLILDALVVVLGAPYLSKNIGAFLGKSNTAILSDLLFLEGAVIFAMGTFITLLRPMQEKELSHKPSTETADNGGQTREKRIRPCILMMIIGAILIGLSITVETVGTLLL